MNAELYFRKVGSSTSPLAKPRTVPSGSQGVGWVFFRQHFQHISTRNLAEQAGHPAGVQLTYKQPLGEQLPALTAPKVRVTDLGTEFVA